MTTVMEDSSADPIQVFPSVSENPVFPDPPSFEAITGSLELIGPKNPFTADKTFLFRVIDRSLPQADPFAMPGTTQRYSESYPVVLSIAGPDADLLRQTAEAAFVEYKRRLFYVAGEDWKHLCDKIKVEWARAKASEIHRAAQEVERQRIEAENKVLRDADTPPSKSNPDQE